MAHIKGRLIINPYAHNMDGDRIRDWVQRAAAYEGLSVNQFAVRALQVEASKVLTKAAREGAK